jgi:hypothetical protein
MLPARRKSPARPTHPVDPRTRPPVHEAITARRLVPARVLEEMKGVANGSTRERAASTEEPGPASDIRKIKLSRSDTALENMGDRDRLQLETVASAPRSSPPPESIVEFLPSADLLDEWFDALSASRECEDAVVIGDDKPNDVEAAVSTASSAAPPARTRPDALTTSSPRAQVKRLALAMLGMLALILVASWAWSAN